MENAKLKVGPSYWFWWSMPRHWDDLNSWERHQIRTKHPGRWFVRYWQKSWWGQWRSYDY